ncbi:MAG: TaqI-like C-terminal specificity domain-containing protein [Planctomycetota bacterium]
MRALKDSALRALESIGQALLDSGELPDPLQAENRGAFFALSVPYFFRPFHAFLAQETGCVLDPAQDQVGPGRPESLSLPEGTMGAFFEVCRAWLANRKKNPPAPPCDEEVARLPGTLYEQLLGYTACIAEQDLVVKERRSGRHFFDESSPAGNGLHSRRRAGQPPVRFIPEGSFFLMRERGCSSRKGSGTYYTPGYIVRHMVEQALGPKLRNGRGSLAHPCSSLASHEILALAVVDPAMGSGAFLLAATQYLAEALQSALASEEQVEPSNVSMSKCRQAVIRSCIYGVDLDPHAVEMARSALRLFAGDESTTVSESEMRLKTGDALFGAQASDLPHPFSRSEADALAGSRYPGYVDFFHWELEFPERFLTSPDSREPMESRRGFSVVLSNPPYGDLLSPKAKSALKRFGYPSVGGRAEVAAHFFHQGLRLLEPGGSLSFIVPNTMIDGRQFRRLREDLTTRARVVSIMDYAGDRVFPEADVYAMIVLLVAGPSDREAYDALYQRPAAGTVQAPSERIRVLSRSGAPWRKVLPFVDRLVALGTVELLSPSLALCRDAGLDYKHKRVGWHDRGRKERLNGLLTYEGERRDPCDLPLIRGRDIEPFRVADTHHYLVHDWKKYRDSGTAVLVYEELAIVPVKIVTRQTSDRLVAALDREGRYTAKSVHTVLVTDPDHTPEFLCALLNSRVMNHIYQAYTGERGRAFAQVKVSDLRLLPVRKIGSFRLGREQAEWREHGEELLRSMVRGEHERLRTFVERLLPQTGEGHPTMLPGPTGVAHQLVTEMVRHLERDRFDAGERESLLSVMDEVFDRLYGVSAW